jgi:catechol 2,3-dioxygenase-like lactoylglutathione lyase family enzyme
MKLADSELQTLVWSSDIDRAGTFYSEVLDLPLTGRSHGALVYRVGAGTLRISPVPSTSPSEHTVFGFAVDDIEDIVGQLAARGVEFERFAGFDHAENGIWTAPDATKVAWFRDPDGNLISLVSYA